MLYYALSSFMVSTMIFMMNKLPIFTIQWVVCIALSALIVAMLDKVFMEEDDEWF